jgi:hypothetical protein
VLKALEQAGGLDQLTAAYGAVVAHHGNNYLPLLERYHRSHRSVLFTLVDSIQLEATSAERSVLDAVEFIRANRPAHADRQPVGIGCAGGRPGRRDGDLNPGQAEERDDRQHRFRDLRALHRDARERDGR